MLCDYDRGIFSISFDNCDYNLCLLFASPFSSQSELSEQHEAKVGDETLFAELDDDLGETSDHDDLAASFSDVLLLGNKTDEYLILVIF